MPTVDVLEKMITPWNKVYQDTIRNLTTDESVVQLIMGDNPKGRYLFFRVLENIPDLKFESKKYNMYTFRLVKNDS